MSTRISAVVYCSIMLFYVAYASFGLVLCETVWFNVGVVLFFLFMIAALLLRETIQKRLEPWVNYLKPFVYLILLGIAFYLLERPYNPLISGIELPYLIVNLGIIAVLFCIFYFLGQRSKASAIIFLALCFIMGMANYFVTTFKGQPVLPADLFALETAAAVSGGYIYALSENAVKALCALLFGCLLILFLPKRARGVSYAISNTVAGILFVCAFSIWLSSTDLEKTYECTVDPWGVQDSYAEQGSLLCFLKRTQDLVPKAPNGYSQEAVAEVMASYLTGAQTGGIANANEEKPSVVVVMNETFADLSEYQVLQSSYSGPAYYQSIDDATVKGNAFVSALGGGTCNSEFEFLTGSSMGSMGGGVYPYMLYDLGQTENLAAYFNDLGYDTCAIHPAEAINWRRSTIYKQFGFDEFLSLDSFEDTETLRDMPTDKATYEVILERLQENDTPQFFFDVTMQNHGGYDTGLVSEEDTVHAPIEGTNYANLDEYLSCLTKSDEDLAFLVEGLRELDKPVILCFFGDHQPEFADWLSELNFNKEVGEFTLEEVQYRYTVPYMIWKNYEDEEGGRDIEPNNPLSLNYLGAQLLKEADLPLSDWQRFLLAVKEELPAINLNGYLDKEGVWRWIGEESVSLDAFQDYALVQYDMLFGEH